MIYSRLSRMLARLLAFRICWQPRRAIEASLGMPLVESLLIPVETPSTGTSEVEDEAALLAEALAVSARETALEEERRSREDAELLQRILELSMLEK